MQERKNTREQAKTAHSNANMIRPRSTTIIIVHVSLV